MRSTQNLGLDDRTLLDIASQPRTTRQRSHTASGSAPGSTQLRPVGASPDGMPSMQLDGGAYHEHEDDEEEEEDDDASAYEDEGSGSLSPPPSGSSPRHSNNKINAGPSRSNNSTAPNPAQISLAPVPATSVDSSNTTVSPRAPSKRGRKPAPAASRTAREQARKTNHSKIEKRRREKINDALSTLREMVPQGIVGILERYGYPPAQEASARMEADAETSPTTSNAKLLASPALSAVNAAASLEKGSGAGGSKDSGKGKGGGEKEFKLEVLERTVVFVKYLLDRVNELEAQTGESGNASLSSPNMTLNLPPPLLPSPPNGLSSPTATTRKRRRSDRPESSKASTSSQPPSGQVEFDHPPKRSRTLSTAHLSQNLVDHSGAQDSGVGMGSGPPSDVSLSPTTTLANGTPYLAASFGGSSLELNKTGYGVPSSPTTTTHISHRPHQDRPRLPSIAAMLNAPSEDELSQLRSTSSIATRPTSRSVGASPLLQPTSGGVSSLPFPGALQLPSSNTNFSRSGDNMGDGDGKSGGGDEDETTAAATLLMHFSSERSERGSSYEKEKERERGSDVPTNSAGRYREERPMAVQTPGSILGLGSRAYGRI